MSATAPATVYESELEELALGWFGNLGWTVAFGPALAPGELFAERESFEVPYLPSRIRDALASLNPKVPAAGIEDALRKVLDPHALDPVDRNRAFHHWLVNGVDVEYARDDGSIAGDKVWLVDFADLDNNDWLAVNQFTVIEGGHNRRPDIVLFVNGLPLGLIELKNPADENATIWTAFHQLQTYKREITGIFLFNEVLVISDGLQARLGALTSDAERFTPWRTVEGDTVAGPEQLQLDTLVHGVFERRRFLDLVRHFVVFEDQDSGPAQKKIAAYHQFHAVNRAVEATVQASAATGDGRAGVVWHTQGSGKSLSMAFYAGRIILHPAMENPTLVVLTDRNDLDDQLFGTFSRCRGLLRQDPVQAESRADLREKLRVASGGVVFTTVQKFFPDEKGDRHPLLTDRHNVVVIADEAHRSQYDFIDGFAKHLRDALPNATFIGFTGTPIELGDRNTKAVFGDYISIYDIQRAVEDGATVPIYYEGRLAQLALDPSERPRLDDDFEDATEGEEADRKEKLKTRWAALEAVVGTEKRIGLIAKDLVTHFERRLEVMDGKALVVCMSRRICIDLYRAIVALRPTWDSNEDSSGAIKIVMTGSASDPLDWQPHIRNKERRRKLADRFRDPKDPLRVVIVRDMWLTGFDVPCLHTMYVDKPMRGHGLMQAIARVNRVFKDKPGGLVVDYLGLADQLKQALHTYTESGGHGTTAVDQAEAVAAMLARYEVCCDLLHGFDWNRWSGGAAAERLRLLPPAQEHILAQENGKDRFIAAVSDLSKAFALSVPHPDALRIQTDVGFFQAVRAALTKRAAPTPRSEEELEFAIRQIVSRAVATDEVVDIFAAAGLKKPDISILSDEFLAEVRDLPHRNVAVELLRRLLSEEIKARGKHHLVEGRSFAAMLEETVKKYRNRALETAAIIEELIRLAKDLRDAERRGASLGLTDDETAFYEALEVNDSAVKVLGDATLKKIAQDLAKSVRESATIDWTLKGSVQAEMRVKVKRILRKYGYPPDKQEQAVKTVVEQAELFADSWAA